MEELVGRLQEEIRYLRGRVARLERENALLKAAIKREAAEIIYGRDGGHRDLDGLERVLYAIVVRHLHVYGKPPSYRDIIKAYFSAYPSHVSPETVTRTLRKMREKGVLFSPSNGYFTVKLE